MYVVYNILKLKMHFASNNKDNCKCDYFPCYLSVSLFVNTCINVILGKDKDAKIL